MSTCLHLKCDGCDAETHTAPIRREFLGYNGRSHGFGSYREPDIDKAVEPTGWVWSDIIGCTYCPECQQKIDAGDPAIEAARAQRS